MQIEVRFLVDNAGDIFRIVTYRFNGHICFIICVNAAARNGS